MTAARRLGSWFLPTGRMRRRDWWLRYVLVIAVLGLVASRIDAQWFPHSEPRFGDGEGFDLLWPSPHASPPLSVPGSSG